MTPTLEPTGRHPSKNLSSPSGNINNTDNIERRHERSTKALPRDWEVFESAEMYTRLATRTRNPCHQQRNASSALVASEEVPAFDPFDIAGDLRSTAPLQRDGEHVEQSTRANRNDSSRSPTSRFSRCVTRSRRNSTGMARQPMSLMLLLERNEIRLSYSFSLIDRGSSVSSDPSNSSGDSFTRRFSRGPASRRGSTQRWLDRQQHTSTHHGRNPVNLDEYNERNWATSGSDQTTTILHEHDVDESENVLSRRLRRSPRSSSRRGLNSEPNQRSSRTFDRPRPQDDVDSSNISPVAIRTNCRAPQMTQGRLLEVQKHLYVTRLNECYFDLEPTKYSSVDTVAVLHPPDTRWLQETDVSIATCSVCLGEYECGQTIAQAKKRSCAHVFHKKCILNWLARHDECPLCRETVVGET
jgi:hypothetical protein